MTRDPAGSSASGTTDQSIVVLMGGPSAEHDVSVVSGWAIADALVTLGYEVERTYIDIEGRWWQMPASASRGRPEAGSFDDPRSAGGRGPFRPGELLEDLVERPVPPLVFPALHGPFGEDGRLQALLEAYELVYAGAGVAASALGMDKVLYKRLVRGLGMPVVDWIEITAAGWASQRQGTLDDVAAFSERLGERRLMVKPARLGSSVGMSIAHTTADRAACIDEALRFDNLVIVERYLDHPRELEVAVIGNDPARLEAFGPGEVFPGHEFYDYVAKYSDGVSRVTPKAGLPETMAGRVRGLALDSYRAIGCEGFARVDFLLAGDDLYLSELNTIPGFTPISLFPQMAATGLGSFEAVCRRIVELAQERGRSRVGHRLTTADLPR